MNKYIQIFGLMLLLVVLAWGATAIGGIGIRRVKPLGERIILNVSEPAIPGVGTVVHWNVPPLEEKQPVVLKMRTSDTTIDVGSATMGQGNASVEFACDYGGQAVSLLLTRAEDGEVAASSEVELLPAGPDCAQ